MSGKHILLIDDESIPGTSEPSGGYMWYYTQALRDHGFKVTEVMGPDEALLALASTETHFDLVILDIMMPPGDAYRGDDTKQGLRTGVILAGHLLQHKPDTPVVVLTNVLNPSVLGQLERMKNVKMVLCKLSCTPFQLRKKVSGLLET